MMNMPKIAYSLLLLLTYLAVTITAQSIQPKQPHRTKSPVLQMAEITPNQQHALSLLDALYEQAKSFENEQLKIRVQAQIADILWRYDEPRARQLFTQIFHTINSIKSPVLTNEKPSNSDHEANYSKDSLRHEVLRMVSRHDISLAEMLMKSANESKSKTESNNTTNDSQSVQPVQDMQLAMAVAKTNPERAAQIVENSLRYGINELLVPTLNEIRQKNTALADKLFASVLVVASKEPPSVLKIATLAMYVLPREHQAFHGRDKELAPVPRVLIRQFLDFAYQALWRWADVEEEITLAGAGQSDRQKAVQDFTILQQVIMPLFDKHAPEKAASLRPRLAPLASARSIKGFGSSPLSNQMEVQDLIEAAEAANTTQRRDDLYMRAAMLAARKNDIDQALSLTEKISDEQDKFLISSMIRYQAGLKALHQANVDAAYRHAKEIYFIPQRAKLFDEVARKLLEKKDYVRATEVLHEIETWLSKADSVTQKAEGLLIIATTVAGYDPVRGFDVMRATVKAINAADFARRPGKDSAYKGKLKVVSIALEMLSFKSGFSSLARADFHQALLLAQSLEKKEPSAMAQLAVCQEVLNSSPASPAENKVKRSRR